MITTQTHRFRSGEKCVESAEFEFDGFLDGSAEQLPAPEEMTICVSTGQPFPGAGPDGKPSFWRLSSDSFARSRVREHRVERQSEVS